MSKKPIVVDFEEPEITDRDKHIGRKPMGKVTVDVRDAETIRSDTLKESKRIHKEAMRGLKAQIKVHKLQIKKAKLEYKISKG